MSEFPNPNSSSSLCATALSGFAASASYDTYRPTYYPPAVALLLSKLRLAERNAARVVEMAAGTGKFTEILAGREERFEVIAVEPHDEMRRVLVGKRLPGVRVLGGDVEGCWEEGGVTEGWADAVVVAQMDGN